MTRRPCLDCGLAGPWNTPHGIRCPRCYGAWLRLKRATHRYQAPPTGQCVRCGGEGDLTWDHEVSVGRGGTSARGNMQVLCRRCNGRKGRLEDRLH